MPDIVRRVRPVSGENQFWEAAKVDVGYWQEYLSARPKYHNGDFYELILKYYQSHQKTSSSLPRVAHDIGTGPGQVAMFLAEHFDEVVASDLNATHLEVARHMLEASKAKSKITLAQIGGEQVSRQFPEYSADFIAAAECMPLMNIPAATEAWASLLKPNGTLAIWFYGRPAFEDAENFDAATCNDIYDDICSRAFRPFYDVTGPKLVNVKKATDTMVSWLDNVELDPSVWADVRRYKWNTKYPMEFSNAEDLGWPKNYISKVHSGEKVEEVPDNNLWSEEWTIDDWKTFLKVNLPAFSGQWDDFTNELWSELEEVMGGPEVRRKIVWPVVAILATRKGMTSASFWT